MRKHTHEPSLPRRRIPAARPKWRRSGIKIHPRRDGVPASTACGSQIGVTLNDPALAYAGLNLYTSGHSRGRLDGYGRYRCFTPGAVHSTMQFPDTQNRRMSATPRANPGAAPPLYPDGSLLAIFEGMALIKIDTNSNVIWSYAAGCHHDMQVLPDGTIYVLTSEPRDGNIDNGIALLDANGKPPCIAARLFSCFVVFAVAFMIAGAGRRAAYQHHQPA